MADIRLAKPAAGASESIQCAPEARFVFDFPTTDATLAREGDNLNISFQDGSQLQLQGFYQQYNEENLPSFNIDGTEVAAADFFQAMNEPDLMPAAGPGTGTVANGARFHEWGDSALTGGITHLDGLDWGFSRSFEWDDVPNAVGYDDAGWRGAANTVPDLDVPAAPERPYDPRNPGDDPNNPASPQNPGGYIPNTHGASIVVDEGALAKGSGQHVLHGAHDFGSFVSDVHAERGGSIELSFGGKVVTLEIPQDGSLRIAPSGDASFANVNGVDIRILGAESAGDGKWVVRYEYRLDDHIEHDKLLGQDTVRYDGEGIAITITDGSGDVTHGRITVEVHDDVPVLESVSFDKGAVVDATEKEFTVNLDGLLTGADADGAALTVAVNGTVFVGHRNGSGEWEFAADTKKDGEDFTFRDGTFTYARPDADMDGDQTDTYTFTATITDGDNDSVSRTNSITTIAKPKFVDDPNPTPEPKDPNPEGGELAKQISNVFTDDSYVAGGTLDPARAPQTLADEVAPARDAEGGESASAATPTNIAEGSFSLTMNGQPITVTIAGENGAITLEFLADGTLDKTDYSHNAGAKQLTSENRYGHLEVGEPEVVGDTIRVNYTFTQDTAYQRHTNSDGTEASKNELEHSADSFTVTLRDDLGQADEGSIRVSIHDDAPELKDLVITSEGMELLDSVPTIKGTVAALEGADTDGATLKVEVNDTTFEGTRDAAGAWVFTKSGGAPDEDFSIDAKGVFTYTRPTGHVGEKDEYAPNNYTFKFTLKDADGDTVTDSKTVKTIAKPKFVEDPDPTPDPKDDPQGVEPAAPDGQISSVVTDDSWVTGGTKAPAATPQTMADEPTPAGDAEGGESASAAEPTDSANGSFSLTMNGQPITVTIAGEDGAAITLKFAADGELESRDGPRNADGVQLDQLTSEYGYGHLEVGEPEVVGDTIKVNYTFTQTKAYEKHVDPTDTDELAYDADSFTVTLEDKLHQKDEGTIRVSIHDDAPVVTAPTNIRFTYTEADTKIAPSHEGDFGFEGGADGVKNFAYSLEVVEGNNRIQARHDGGKWQEVTLTSSGDTVKATLADGTEAFELKIDEQGNVSMTAASGIAIRHTDGEATLDGKDLDGVKAVLTVTDGDGDTVTKESPVSIEIADTAAGLENFQNSKPVSAEHNHETSLSIDFQAKNHDGTIIKDGESRAAYKGDINFYGTHVAYDMKDGHVTWLEDQVTDFANPGDITSVKPTWADDEGLGIAGNAGGKEFGVGNAQVTSSSTYDERHPDYHSNYHSEGIVIEPGNGTVNYGLTLTLGNFDPGERAIVAFYLTPKNNNDNSIVKYVELNAEENGTHYTYGDGKYVISVPDGFTKCIIAPIPTKEASGSQFSIDKIEFTQPAVTRTGSLEVTPGADGVAFTTDENDVNHYSTLSWNWDNVEKELLAKGVFLEDTIGKGEYKIGVVNKDGTIKPGLTYEDGGKTVIAKLVGNSGDYSQNGHTLFSAHLNDDGTWVIQQFYKFTVGGEQLNDCKVDFIITDGDGSITQVPHGIDLSLDSPVNRFDNVEMGAFDKRPTGEGGWGNTAGFDNVYDVLQGDGINDLMYGRGGNDIMFGDKTDFNDFATTLLGPKAGDGDYVPTEYDKDSTAVPAYGPGDNADTVDLVYDGLKSLVEKGDKDSLDKLDKAVLAAEGSAGGDDALFGGVGDDILFGGAGDDYLVGTGNVAQANANQSIITYTDRNMLFGGSGRDILVYNQADKIVDGGDGIDILLMGKKDWETATNSTNSQKTTLRRLLMGLEKGPVVRNIELMLISKNTDFVEQLGITSQASLAAYGIEISGTIVKLNETMWEYSESKGCIHSNDLKRYPGTDPRIDRYYNEEHDLYLDVLRDGHVQLVKNDGKTPFDGLREWDDPPAKSDDSEASAMFLMDEGSAVVMASDAPEEGESVTQDAAFAPTPAQEEAPADTAPEATPADIVETRESFLDRVESLGGSEDEVAFGTGGGDYLDSADDSYVFADAGDDLIVYDPTDYLIDGGTGIDFLLSDGLRTQYTLAEMLDNYRQHTDADKPMVHDVEVMLKGVDTSLQNMDALAKEYGFSMDKDADGRDILVLDNEKWKLDKDQSGNGTNTYVNVEKEGVTLETTLTEDTGSGMDEQAAQAIVLSSNG